MATFGYWVAIVPLVACLAGELTLFAAPDNSDSVDIGGRCTKPIIAFAARFRSFRNVGRELLRRGQRGGRRDQNSAQPDFSREKSLQEKKAWEWET
jgi:hypothetical protein